MNRLMNGRLHWLDVFLILSVIILPHPFHSNISPYTSRRLFEYQWPLGEESAEHYMLQEQVAEYLDIRGIQRKYPGALHVRAWVLYVHIVCTSTITWTYIVCMDAI